VILISHRRPQFPRKKFGSDICKDFLVMIRTAWATLEQCLPQCLHLIATILYLLSTVGAFLHYRYLLKQNWVNLIILEPDRLEIQNRPEPPLISNSDIKADQDLASILAGSPFSQSFPYFTIEDRFKLKLMQQPGPLQSKDGFCACLSGKIPNGPLRRSHLLNGKIK